MSRVSRLLAGVAGLALGTLIAAAPASASPYKVIYKFGALGSNDGWEPFAAPVADSAGHLYVTTFKGGPSAGGSVARLTKTGNTWKEDMVFNFPGGAGVEGPVLIGPAGELYGTTRTGGTFASGTVWKLVPNGATWTLTTLHEFNPINSDGYYPSAGVVFGKDGLLYGTTTGFDANNQSRPVRQPAAAASPNMGTVYSISPLGDTTAYSILHVFGGGNDGKMPFYGSLLVNQKGVLTGTTQLGGFYSSGIVFRLTPPKAGKTVWKETVLHHFGAPGAFDAVAPLHNVKEAEGGVLFGCAGGGSNGNGAIFALTAPETADAKWGEKILYNFGDQANDPQVSPDCEMTLGPHGVFYGAATGGGADAKGAFFRLTPPAGGQTAWTEQVMHSFGQSAGDGLQPLSGPARVGTSYFGTTSAGGNGTGAVYEMDP
ncbi:MAG TPA: choice-of-anchor tandem repeat GloVer-containing protein [Rhizomicrobium sp.]|jgi:hypothetical protein